MFKTATDIMLSTTNNADNLQMIIIASPLKPPLMTEKGTIRRGATIATYEEEIEATYASFELSSEVLVPVHGVLTPDLTLDFIRSTVKAVLPANIGDDDDILDAGCSR